MRLCCLNFRCGKSEKTRDQRALHVMMPGVWRRKRWRYTGDGISLLKASATDDWLNEALIGGLRPPAYVLTLPLRLVLN